MLTLGLIGDPVAHSESPRLYERLMAEAAIPGRYDLIAVPAGSAAQEVARLRALGYRGLNVTTPLKEEAYALAQRRDRAASTSRAINTLVFGPQIEGYNTDGIAAVEALRQAGLRGLAGARVLVLGAGPTARSAVAALIWESADVSIWNRTRQHAADIAGRVGGRLWEPRTRCDAVFAALPPGAWLDETVAAAVRATPLVVDANYGERATLRTTLGRSDLHDGMIMLAAAARASFAFFTAA